MSIHDLPLELFQQIVSYCNPQTISSLSSTCNSLKYHAHPLLYADIDHDRRFGSRCLPNIQLLTRSLLNNASLGAKVKALRLRGPEFWPTEFNTDSRISDAERALLASQGVLTGHSNHRTWHHALLANSREAFLVVLLSYLPSLASLAFEDDPNVHFNVHHYSIGSWNPPVSTHPALGSKPSSLFAQALTKLPKLKSVELGLRSEGVRLGHNAPILLLLQSLPTLETLSVALRQPPATSSTTYFPLPPLVNVPPSNLSTLHIHNCALSERSTLLVTGRFPNLTTLSISFLRTAITPFDRLAGRVPPNSHTWLDCVQFGQYLAACPPPKLQHLAISVSFQTIPSSKESPRNGGAYECGRARASNSDPICFFGIKGSMGSLKYLTSLETLSIPTPMLLGWYPHRAEPLRSLLPDSLKELVLRGDVFHWDLCKWDAHSLQDQINDCLSSQGTGKLTKIDYDGSVDHQGAEYVLS